MKRIIIACLFVALLSAKACQTDDSAAIYQQNQTSVTSTDQSGVLSSTPAEETATSEFSGTLYDKAQKLNIIEDGYSI